MATMTVTRDELAQWRHRPRTSRRREFRASCASRPSNICPAFCLHGQPISIAERGTGTVQLRAGAAAPADQLVSTDARGFAQRPLVGHAAVDVHRGRKADVPALQLCQVQAHAIAGKVRRSGLDLTLAKDWWNGIAASSISANTWCAPTWPWSWRWPSGCAWRRGFCRDRQRRNMA